MKIKVELNKHSINKAIETLKKAQSQLKGDMLDEFYRECYNFFVVRANNYLSSSDIGNLVISDIESSWRFEKTNNGAKFTNNAEKAVYVEFGVGAIGSENPHPNANETSYQYDVNSKSKTWDRSWYFYTNSNELDIPLSSLTDIRGFDDHRGKRGKRLVVGTRGTKGCFYAFNALDDLRLEIPKIWKKIEKKYWG